MVGASLFLLEGNATSESTSHWARIWTIAHLAFGIVYWFASCRPQRQAISHPVALTLVGCSLGISYYSETGLGGILLMVTASLLPWLMSARSAAMWIAIANLTATAALLLPPIDMPLQTAAMQLLIYAGFSAFMLAGSWVAMEQTSARETQDRLASELQATRLLLEHSALASERTRISRDVHDLLGHHLTALILNLDVAGRLASSREKAHVDQSQALARLLLSDVREVVSRLREHGTTGFREAIQQILDSHPDVSSTLEFKAQIELDDDGSIAVLWCVREVLALAVAKLDLKDIRIGSWRDLDTTNLVICSDASRISRLHADGHLKVVESLFHLHGGTISSDTGSSTLVLRIAAPSASAPRARAPGY